jgi:predicted TIM-barrel fold metal-dependent hydrolase
VALPAGIGVIDLMVGMPPGPGDRAALELLRPQLRDRESLEAMEFPAQYLFGDLPEARFAADPLGAILREMDRFGVERGMIPVTADNDVAQRALRDHPDRFFGSCAVDPNQGTAGVRSLRRMAEEFGVKAATGFPAGTFPPAPINDRRWYPIYAACIDLDLPICLCAGVPGPRVPVTSQDVALLDDVCWAFPELTIVTRHGCEPWSDLVVALMLKWPNLHYSTSAFAPRHYPPAIVDFANTRGREKVLYAGYFPMGLSLERIFAELPSVPFRERVWPAFLRENAIRVFKLA